MWTVKAGTLKPVIQFGKQSESSFSLDFRFPFCPLQAFGLFLTVNAWTIKNRPPASTSS
jgi:hypothetical protein